MEWVSVIIPTFNRPELLRRTLESVKRQTYPNVEVIVVDDGSEGNGNEVLCATFPDVRYYKIQNSGGPAKPRNIGVEKAKGAYIAFLDDDDLWIEEKLATQVAILDSHPAFGMVHGPCKLIDAQGSVTSQIIGRPRDTMLKHGDVSLRMMGRWTLMTSSVVMRKSVFWEVGWFNETMPAAGEDTEFWSRCAFYTQFYYIDEPLVLYRKHHGISSQGHHHYFELPLYLMAILQGQRKQGNLTPTQFSTLRNQVIGRQLKEASVGKVKTLKRLFKIYPFWFLNFENVKIFLSAFRS